MRLLHLSDIHFKEPGCLAPNFDPERPFRTRLQADLEELCIDQAVDAIVVVGDIAYKAHKDEYATARTWLLELADACGCKPDEIFVVPGNHDVDRGVCRKELRVAYAQHQIANSAPIDREQVLAAQLADDHTGQALFLPLAEYNRFAEEFGCNVFPSRPSWKYDLPIGGGVTLSIHGLTSTLISGLADRDEVAGKLYLSPLQTAFDPLPDILNMVICHHPPNWFLDSHDIDTHVNERAQLQFFGHEHRIRCHRTPEFIRFSGGAVNPDRRENDWMPGYNLVDIVVEGEGAARAVLVTARIRHLLKSPERYAALLTGAGEQMWTHRIALPAKPKRSRPVTGSEPDVRPSDPAPLNDPAAANQTPVAVPQPVEVAMSSPSTKNLRFRFGNLTTSQKRELAFKLNLITEADMGVPGPERYAQALRRAAERGLLEQLGEEIELLEQQG